MEDFSALSDEELLLRARHLAEVERASAVRLVACLAEIERREFLLDRGYVHLFDYCVRGLRMSEGAASRRVAATRGVRRWPEALSLLSDGSITLSALARVEPYLHSPSGLTVLFRLQGRDRRALDELVLELAAARQEERRGSPAEEPPPPVLPLGDRGPSQRASLARPSSDRSVRLSEERIRFSFECSSELERKLERVGTLLSHRVPSGRLEDVIDAMADIVIRGLDPSERGRRASRAVKGHPRRVPWAVRKQVWERDGARCSYAAPDGTRCSATRRLQYDHVTPWALGGRSDDAANIRLLCRAHNLREGKKAFPRATARALAARAAGGADGGTTGTDGGTTGTDGGTTGTDGGTAAGPATS